MVGPTDDRKGPLPDRYLVTDLLLAQRLQDEENSLEQLRQQAEERQRKKRAKRPKHQSTWFGKRSTPAKGRTKVAPQQRRSGQTPEKKQKTPRRIRPKDCYFEVGDLVEATWNCKRTYFPGEVMANNGDGSYGVQYEDGDYDPAVLRSEIRYRKDALRTMRRELRQEKVEEELARERAARKGLPYVAPAPRVPRQHGIPYEDATSSSPPPAKRMRRSTSNSSAISEVPRAPPLRAHRGEVPSRAHRREDNGWERAFCHTLRDDPLDGHEDLFPLAAVRTEKDKEYVLADCIVERLLELGADYVLHAAPPRGPLSRLPHPLLQLVSFTFRALDWPLFVVGAPAGASNLYGPEMSASARLPVLQEVVELWRTHYLDDALYDVRWSSSHCATNTNGKGNAPEIIHHEGKEYVTFACSPRYRLACLTDASAGLPPNPAVFLIRTSPEVCVLGGKLRLSDVLRLTRLSDSRDNSRVPTSPAGTSNGNAVVVPISSSVKPELSAPCMTDLIAPSVPAVSSTRAPASPVAASPVAARPRATAWASTVPSNPTCKARSPISLPPAASIIPPDPIDCVGPSPLQHMRAHHMYALPAHLMGGGMGFRHIPTMPHTTIPSSALAPKSNAFSASPSPEY